MKVEVKLDPNYTETKIEIHTNQINEEISNSEIINFNKVENLDLNITGTIKITFKDKYVTYASRRNIKKIKEYLKYKKESDLITFLF